MPQDAGLTDRGALAHERTSRTTGADDGATTTVRDDRRPLTAAAR